MIGKSDIAPKMTGYWQDSQVEIVALESDVIANLCPWHIVPFTDPTVVPFPNNACLYVIFGDTSFALFSLLILSFALVNDWSLIILFSLSFTFFVSDELDELWLRPTVGQFVVRLALLIVKFDFLDSLTFWSTIFESMTLGRILSLNN